VARSNIPDEDLEFSSRRQNAVRQNLPGNSDSNNNSRVQTTMRTQNIPDFDPDSNHWVMFDHLVGALISMKKHPIKSTIVILGCGSAPFFVGAMLIGLFRGTQFASKGGFDPVAMGSSFGANVARPVVFGAGTAVEATFVGWSGQQPTATPVELRQQRRNSQAQRNWVTVPTNYDGN